MKLYTMQDSAKTANQVRLKTVGSPVQHIVIFSAWRSNR